MRCIALHYIVLVPSSAPISERYFVVAFLCVTTYVMSNQIKFNAIQVNCDQTDRSSTGDHKGGTSQTPSENETGDRQAQKMRSIELLTTADFRNGTIPTAASDRSIPFSKGGDTTPECRVVLRDLS